jgi:hypothetical protein
LFVLTKAQSALVDGELSRSGQKRSSGAHAAGVSAYYTSTGSSTLSWDPPLLAHDKDAEIILKSFPPNA